MCMSDNMFNASKIEELHGVDMVSNNAPLQNTMVQKVFISLTLLYTVQVSFVELQHGVGQHLRSAHRWLRRSLFPTPE
jgi:hypothetical protein